jgi:hypothetical protein
VGAGPLSGIRTPPLASADVSRPLGCPVQRWSSRCDAPWHHNTVSAAAMYTFSEPRVLGLAEGVALTALLHRHTDQAKLAASTPYP